MSSEKFQNEIEKEDVSEHEEEMQFERSLQKLSLIPGMESFQNVGMSDNEIQSHLMTLSTGMDEINEDEIMNEFELLRENIKQSDAPNLSKPINNPDQSQKNTNTSMKLSNSSISKMSSCPLTISSPLSNSETHIATKTFHELPISPIAPDSKQPCTTISSNVVHQDEKSTFSPKTIEDVLQYSCDYYTKEAHLCINSDAARHRRLKRIIEKFKTAQNCYKAGKEVTNLKDLPLPSGISWPSDPKSINSSKHPSNIDIETILLQNETILSSISNDVIPPKSRVDHPSSIGKTSKMPPNQNEPNMVESKRVAVPLDSKLFPEHSISPSCMKTSRPGQWIKANTAVVIKLLENYESKLQTQMNKSRTMGWLNLEKCFDCLLQLHKKELFDLQMLSDLENPTVQIQKLSWKLPSIKTFPSVKFGSIGVEILHIRNLISPKADDHNFSFYYTLEFDNGEGKRSVESSYFENESFQKIGQTYEFLLNLKNPGLMCRTLQKNPLSIFIKRYRGIFKKCETFAVAHISLNDLIEQSEVHTTQKFCDPVSRNKLIAGEVEVKIRMRQPLFGLEVTFNEYEYVVQTHSSAVLLPMDYEPYLIDVTLDISKFLSFNVIKNHVERLKARCSMLINQNRKFESHFVKLYEEVAELKMKNIENCMSIFGQAYKNYYKNKLSIMFNEDLHLKDQLIAANDKVSAKLVLERMIIVKKELNQKSSMS